MLKPHIQLMKACDCRSATASGPRIVTTKAECDEEQQTVSVYVQLVTLACDECDTPWVSVMQMPQTYVH
jgi:hypothetical protein